MRNTLSTLSVLGMILCVLTLFFLPVFTSTAPVVEDLPEAEIAHLEWCDRIYHQNVSCSEHGRVKVPSKVLAEQKASFEAWCDEIYHRNVGCPKYGQVKVPAEVLAEEQASLEVWCARTGYRNVSCQKFKRQ